MLSITTNKDGSNLTLALSGRLDAITAMDLDQALRECNTEDVRALTFDVGNVEYISSAGLRIMLRTTQELDMRGGRCSIAKASSSLLETFEVTGLMTILHIV